MTFTRKQFTRRLGVGAIAIALVGGTVGAGVTLALLGDPTPTLAPSATVLERRVHEATAPATESPVAMITTRPASQPLHSTLLGSMSGTSRVTPTGTTSPTRAAAQPGTQDSTRDSERGELRVRRLVLATGIEAREPTGVAVRFDGQQERLYAFVELANTGEATSVEISFEPVTPSREAQVTGLVSLEVPSGVARHRTWAWSRHVHAPGQWSAVVRDDQGRELARERFEIGASQGE